MVSKYHNQPTEALRALMANTDLRVSAGIKTRCEIMLVLHGRGELNAADKVGAFRFFAPIADGKLDPLAAVSFGDGSIAAMMVRKFAAGVALDVQRAFVAGEPAMLAEHDAAGEIKIVSKRFDQMTMRELDLAWGDGRARTFAEQKIILASRTAARPRVARSKVAKNWRADTKAGELICGQMRIRPTELGAALKALGFKIVRIEPAKGR